MASLVLPPDVPREDVFVDAVFTLGEHKGYVSKVLLVAEPKNLRLPDPEISFSYQAHPTDATKAFILVSAKKFAAYVWVSPLVGSKKLSDNGFHLLPGETKTVVVSGLSAKSVKDGEKSFLRVTKISHLQYFKEARPEEKEKWHIADDE